MKSNNTFADKMRDLASQTRTENGAIAYWTTSNALVDLFGTIGALRNSDNERLYRLIDGCYAEDKTLLAKMLFYARDIRGGLGERETFRTAIHYCALRYPNVIEKNLHLIPEYGRWDDYFALIDTPLEGKMWEHVRKVYELDLDAIKDGSSVSLLAKWLPSADASSENTRKKGCYTAKMLGRSVYDYKREVKAMRRVIDTIEAHMSAQDWHTYDYSKIPSNAMLKYTKAFYRNDGERYSNYIKDVSSGKAKIHSATLFPSDIIKKLGNLMDKQNNDICQELWNALPNYVEGENNFVVMADVSGSMYGLPMQTSVGLAIYFAERNKGAFKDLFMTFSSTPSFVHIPPHFSLADKCKLVYTADWGGSTNIEAAFRKILDVAIQSKTVPEDMPKSLIIITDMEFDMATRSQSPIFYEVQEMFTEAGYEMPNVVFWNVNSFNRQQPVTMNEEGVTLVSGMSPQIFAMLKEDNLNPYAFMMSVISSARYEKIAA